MDFSNVGEDKTFLEPCIVNLVSFLIENNATKRHMHNGQLTIAVLAIDRASYTDMRRSLRYLLKGNHKKFVLISFLLYL